MVLRERRADAGRHAAGNPRPAGQRLRRGLHGLPQFLQRQARRRSPAAAWSRSAPAACTFARARPPRFDAGQDAVLAVRPDNIRSAGGDRRQRVARPGRAGRISRPRAGGRRPHQRRQRRVWVRTPAKIDARRDTIDLDVPGCDKARRCCPRNSEHTHARRGPNRRDAANSTLARRFLCLLPSLLYVLCMFVYPFLYGIYLSLQPKKGPASAWRTTSRSSPTPISTARSGSRFSLAHPVRT